MNNNEKGFVRETIKEKPVKKKKIVLKYLSVIALAVVFAVVFCLVSAFLLPALNKISNKKDNTNTEDTEIVTETEETETEEVAIDPALFEAFTVEGYQSVEKALYKIGKEANKSIVVVTGMSSNTDWFEDTYTTAGEGGGVIISSTGSEYRILTDASLLKNASSAKVTFVNDAMAEATIKGIDDNTGLAVLAVSKKDLDSATTKSIQVITIETEGLLEAGDVVIALGSPSGHTYSVIPGLIASTTGEISETDYCFTRYSTNIVSNKNGSGILINTQGHLVGVIHQDENDAENGTVSAIPSSQITKMITKLVSGKKLPYLGLDITTINNRTSAYYDLPTGVYVNVVHAKSPAMTAGIQVGDVIIEMNGEVIRNVHQYRNALLAVSAGDKVEMKVKRKGSDGYREITYEIKMGE